MTDNQTESTETGPSSSGFTSSLLQIQTSKSWTANFPFIKVIIYHVSVVLLIASFKHSLEIIKNKTQLNTQNVWPKLGIILATYQRIQCFFFIARNNVKTYF